jgi:hypothetical protein
VEVRYRDRQTGNLGAWKIHTTQADYEEAVEDWWVLRRRGFSRVNIRIRDTQAPKRQQFIYP